MRNIAKRFMITTKRILQGLYTGRLKPDNNESSPVKVMKKCPLVNIYHCCTHKSGSQWLKAVFKDTTTFSYSGLEQYSYADYLPGKMDPRKITERYFKQSFPKNKIVSPLYISYDSISKVPKSGRYKTIYILRDPRDLVVSDYFSMKLSHSPYPQVVSTRNKLLAMDETKGLVFCLQRLVDNGTFGAQRSWIHAKDDTILMVRYEDLISADSKVYFRKIFDHCEIDLPEEVLGKLIDRYSFKKMSKGRNPGQEDKQNHYRKGIAGDWQNCFSDNIKNVFKQKTGDLLIVLGYEQDMNW